MNNCLLLISFPRKPSFRVTRKNLCEDFVLKIDKNGSEVLNYCRATITEYRKWSLKKNNNEKKKHIWPGVLEQGAGANQAFWSRAMTLLCQKGTFTSAVHPP